MQYSGRAELEEPIAAIEQELARLEEEIENHTGGIRLSLDRLYRKQDWAEERLRRARQRRDHVPADCWCRGTGGVGKRSIQVDDETFAYLVDEYCDCEAAKVRRRADLDTQIAARRHELRQRLNRWLEDDLPESCRAFRKHELSTFPTGTVAQQEVVQRLLVWSGHDDEADARYDRGERQKAWLYLHGPVGRGKTGLSIALAKMTILDSMNPVVVIDVPSLLSRLRRTFAKGADESAGDVFHEMENAAVLVLDDLGSEYATDWACEQLFSLINHRYGMYTGEDDDDRLTIITSNYDLQGLAEHLGGVAGERVAWRIGERSEVVSLEGCPNLRIPKPSPTPASAVPS